MAKKNTSEIKFTVELNENKIPEAIRWKASEAKNGNQECKATMITLWDREEQTSMRIDLWTQDFRVDEMNALFFENFMTLADTYQNATGNKELSEKIREFGKHFGEEAKVIKRSH